MPPRRHVMLMVETSLGFGRDVLAGVSKYLIQHGPWSVHLGYKELISDPPEWLHGWNGDGVISRSTTPELAEWFVSRGLPVVDLTDMFGRNNLPSIWNDHEKIGEMGAKHLLERGFQTFAFCGFSDQLWSRQRQAGFERVVERNGFKTLVHGTPWSKADSWENQQQSIGAWVRSLPKPLGLMACNDVRALDVLDAARRVNVSVPEQAAVLGVDDDAVVCNMCDPPLSSISVNGRRVGYEAAALLNKLMEERDGGRTFADIVAAGPIHASVPPVEVVTRASTDTLAIADMSIASAVRLIREQACNGLTVNDVLDATGLSRSILERRFRKHLGRSPQAEIRSARLKRVKELLAETPMSLEQIAARTGFEHTEYLSVMFKREIGVTPGQYRSESKAAKEEE